MPHRTLLLPLSQMARRIPTHKRPITFLFRKNTSINLMLGHQELSACTAAQIICFYRIAEGDRARGRFGAEDDHVSEVAFFGFEGLGGGGGVVTVDAEGGEDGVDGADNEARGGEKDVTGVVLMLDLIMIGRAMRLDMVLTIAITPFGFRRLRRFPRNSVVNRSTGSAPPVKTSCTI